MQGMDASLLGQIFRVSEKLMTQVVKYMVTNMTGSSILKSAGHTGQVKPVNLSVRFILGDRDPHTEEISDSESKCTLDSDDDWESCVSSAEEDEYFYDAHSLDDSQDASYISFHTKSLTSVSNLRQI